MFSIILLVAPQKLLLQRSIIQYDPKHTTNYASGRTYEPLRVSSSTPLTTIYDCVSGRTYKPLRVLSSTPLTTIYDCVSGRICGKSNTSRIEGESVNNITKRSIPIPSPAVGGIPCSSAVM